MDKQQWTAPVWSKNMCPFNEGKRKDIRYIYPDWGNAGPGVISLAHHIENQQTEGLWLRPSISSPSTCFTTLKDIQKKFPLKTIHQYSYPLLQPQRLYPQQHIHHSLAGNCLDVVEIGGQTLVIHVEFASDMHQAVVASRLLPGRYYQNNELKKDDKYFHLERHGNVLVDKSVCQVLSKSLHNDLHVLVRSPTTVQLAGLGHSWLIKNNLEAYGDSITSDAALSSVLPGLWSLVTVSGEVTLHDANAEQPLWTTCYRVTKKMKNESARIFKCDFGRHPLVLFVGNESSVRLYDTRIHPDSHRNLFDIKNVDYISTQGHICSIVSGIDQPHLYLVMDECVYVIDDRQQKTPLMHWRHMLPERPALSTLNKLNSLEILMMSSTQNKEVCMISSEWECGKQQCHGVSVPCHFPTLRDTAAFAHSHGVWFTNQVQERLEKSMWLGMASLSHPAESDSILFLSLHNSGDIFMSQFQTSHSEKHTTTLPLDDSQGQAILTKWEEDVLDISSHNWSCQSVNYVDVTGFFNQVLSKSSSLHIEEMLTGLPEAKFNHLNASFNGMETEGLHKSNNNVQVSASSECGAKTCSKSTNNGKKCTFHNTEKPKKEKSHIWNLKDQVQTYRSNCAPKCKGGATWNKSLMETYVIDQTVDSLGGFPVFFSDSCIEDSLSKFLPGSVLLDLKIDKIKNCDDFLSQKIMSLWLGGKNPNIKNEDDDIEGHGTSDGRLSSLVGILEAPISRHGFRYRTSPLDLASLSARLSTFQPHHSKDDQSPKLDELSESYTCIPEITLECSQKTSVKSKRVGKKLKRKRVDGF